MDWARVLAYVTGTVDQDLLARNEYLAAENRILKAQLKWRLKLSDAERATLGEIGHRLDAFLETCEHGFLVAGIDVDDAVRGETDLGKRGRKKILPRDAPEDSALCPPRDAGGEKGGRLTPTFPVDGLNRRCEI
jgi:hypothetical protein